jgi:hypothetical protein
MSEVHDWACIVDGKVEKVVRWDGLTAWPPADDYLMVDLTGHPYVGVGWDYADGQFIDNRPEPDDD